MNHFFLIAAAILFSTGGAAIKLASLTGWQIASFRSAIAAVALLGVLPEARRCWSWAMIPAASAYAATLILFVLSTRTTTAANAIFLQSTAPLYLLLLGPLVLGERLRKSDLAFGAAVACGMALFFVGVQNPLATAPNPRFGNLAAAASGLTWALTVTGLRAIGRQGGVNRVPATVAAGNLIAFVVTMPAAMPVTALGAADLAVVVYLGLAQIALAYFFLSRAIRHVPAFEATTVLLLEPVLNPIWTWLFHREAPGTLALWGGGIILAATLANTWRQAVLKGESH